MLRQDNLSHVQIGDIPTRFKYTHSAPTNFGLSAVEILLATDAELNTIAPVKTLAPYRRGIGMSGKGIGKRIRDLRDELKRRRWGQDAPTPPRWQSNDGTGTGANDLPMGRRREGEAGERKGKRLGRKERMKMKVVEEGDESAPPKGAQGFSTGISHATAIGGGKGETVALGDERGVEKESKKRRKKKNGKAAYGGLVIFD